MAINSATSGLSAASIRPQQPEPSIRPQQQQTEQSKQAEQAKRAEQEKQAEQAKQAAKGAKAQPPKPVVNTQGQQTGSLINTTA